MLDGFMEDHDEEGEPAQIVLSASNFGTFPMGNGLSRLASRFWGDDDVLAKLRQETDRRIDAVEALELGLVTDAPDDIDWEDEVRIMLEERASLSPDALTGMEANHRFVGPETMETRSSPVSRRGRTGSSCGPTRPATTGRCAATARAARPTSTATRV